MRKILNLIVIIVLLGFIFACGSKLDPLSKIENAFLKNESLDKYKLEIVIKGTENESNNTINEKYTYFMNLEEKTAYFIDNASNDQYYLMKDCISNGYYVQSLPWDDFLGENYLTSINSSTYNFKLDNLDIQSTSKNGVTEYKIAIPNEDINDFLKENNINESYQTMSYTNYVITITVDNRGYWTSINLSFDFLIETSYDSSSGNMEISFNILATGNDANFYISQEVKERIYSYYDQHTYDGPRAYQYKRTIDLETPNLPIENTDIFTFHTMFDTISYFDKATKSLILTGWQRLAVYDANTAAKRYDLSSYSQYAYGNGKLVGINDLWNGQMPNRYRISTLDFNTNSTINSVEISGEYLHFFSPYNVSGNTLIIDTNYINYEWLTAFVDTTTGSMYYSQEKLGSTKRVVNYDQNIMYCENSDTTYFDGESTLQFVDIKTGNILKTIKLTGITEGYNNSGLAIIGNSLFFFNKIYDLVSGEVISNSPLIKSYSALSGFTPSKTIYADDKYDIVRGYSENGYELAIYDNKLNKYVFRTAGEFNSAEFDNGIFYVFNYSGFATIDTSKFTGPLDSNMDSVKVTKEANNKVTKLTFPGNYTDLVVNGDYLFVAIGKNIKVFNVNTFNLVKEITTNQNIYRLDAYENTLAVSFGKQYKQFSLIEINSWSMSNVTTEKGITDIQVYNNRIYFTGQDYWDNIFYYDIATKNISMVNTADYSQPYFTINKDKGILYVAETGSSSSDYVYIDLNTNETIYQSSFGLYSYNNFPIIYDGTYVHYFGLIIDSITGERLYKEDYEKMFPTLDGYEFLGTIYYDGNTSIVVALKDRQKVTMVYDLTTNSIIKTNGDAERVIRYKDQFIIVRPNRNDLFIVD